MWILLDCEISLSKRVKNSTSLYLTVVIHAQQLCGSCMEIQYKDLIELLLRYISDLYLIIFPEDDSTYSSYGDENIRYNSVTDVYFCR